LLSVVMMLPPARSAVPLSRRLEVAGFLCRSGTVEEVRRKAEELGLLRSK
jgi:hypothetical protein